MGGVNGPNGVGGADGVKRPVEVKVNVEEVKRQAVPLFEAQVSGVPFADGIKEQIVEQAIAQANTLDSDKKTLNNKEQAKLNEILKQRADECREKPQPMGLTDDNAAAEPVHELKTWIQEGVELKDGSKSHGTVGEIQDENMKNLIVDALNYYKANNTLDGFKIPANIANGDKIKVEIEKDFSDSSNDYNVLKEEDGSYTSELVQVSDGLILRIHFIKEDEQQKQERILGVEDYSQRGKNERVVNKSPHTPEELPHNIDIPVKKQE